MLSAGSQFPEAPGLASLWGRGVQARGRAKEVETVLGGNDSSAALGCGRENNTVTRMVLI